MASQSKRRGVEIQHGVVQESRSKMTEDDEGEGAQLETAARKEAEEEQEQEQEQEEQWGTEWNYSIEVLSHVHVLRIHLLHASLLSPLRHCLNLQASLCPHPPSLSCSWTSPRGSPHSLLLPLPLLPHDLSSPVHCAAIHDHIELRLQLLRVDGQLLSGLYSFLHRGSRNLPSADCDVQMLLSHGEATFYCRSCATSLTRRPFREVVQLPSVDWCEVAEHWFGACCCSFGAKAESLVGDFKRSLTVSQGRCLVGSASCFVDCRDIVPDAFLEEKFFNWTCDHNCRSHDPECMVIHVSQLESISSGYDHDCERICPDASSSYCRENSRPSECPSTRVNVRHSYLKGIESTNGHLMTDPELWKDNTEEILDATDDCVIHKCNSFWSNKLHDGNVTEGVGEKFIELLQVGNGFMTWANEITSSTDWMAVHCSGCSSLVGGCPTKQETWSGLQGIHLYKYQLSTNEFAGSMKDAFRHLTLQNVVAKELQVRTEENASHRFLLRGLKSKLPLLRLVLLNFESWICVGSCSEFLAFDGALGCTKDSCGRIMQTCSNDLASGSVEPVLGNLKNAELKPVVKLLFSNCSGTGADNLRVIEEWAQKHEAETVYMLEEIAVILTRILMSHRLFFPSSCVFLENFHVSFLEM